jgi:hypothetical protein
MSCYWRAVQGGVSEPLALTRGSLAVLAASERFAERDGSRAQQIGGVTPITWIGSHHNRIDRSDNGKPAERRGRKATGLRAASGGRWPPSRRRQSTGRSLQPSLAGDEGFCLPRPSGGEITVTRTNASQVLRPQACAVTYDRLQLRVLSDEVAGVTRPQPLTLTLTRVTPAGASRPHIVRAIGAAKPWTVAALRCPCGVTGSSRGPAIPDAHRSHDRAALAASGGQPPARPGLDLLH